MALSQEKINASQQLVIEVFKGFRDELMAAYGTIEHSAKDNGSPVTELDVKVEETIKARLQAEFPEIGFHGEETEDIVGSENALWIVDPIDGTSSFIHGLPYCTNMAGLVADGQIVASVIYQFPTDELFTAKKGEGVYRNGERIQVKNTELDSSLVFAGAFVYQHLSPIFMQHQMGVYAPLGASGYEFILLAQGKIQAVTKLRCGAQIHDDVPGVLLVQEAGGEIVSFEADEYTYETLSFIAATPNVAAVVRKEFDTIQQIIVQ